MLSFGIGAVVIYASIRIGDPIIAESRRVIVYSGIAVAPRILIVKRLLRISMNS